jgi:3-oxoacyl-[acyl-carrier-protein] synthase II
MTRRRVAITGVGVVSPHGCSADLMFDALMRGESAIRHVPLHSEVGAFNIVGAAVPGEPWSDLPRSQRVTCDRVSQYALVASDAAVRDAGLDLGAEDLLRVGVSVGTSLGGTISQEAAYADIFVRGMSRLSPFTLVKVMYNGPAAQLGLHYGLRGPNLTYTTTCSSSAISVGEAMRQIRHGYVDVMIAGGTEAQFAYVAAKAWQALQVLAPERAENVAATCRPFSRDRNGTVLGEGAAFVILEEYERAVKRNARIYAELAGYGVCNDAGHMTQPSEDAQVHAMQLALDDASVDPGMVDYINAHGTGTVLNDVTETRAIKRVLGRHAQSIPVSSTKSMHGHLVGAAGALELVISTLAVRRNQVPPTAHLNDPDPECDLDNVPHLGRDRQVRVAMTNSFAVGGTAGVLVVRSPRDLITSAPEAKH